MVSLSLLVGVEDFRRAMGRERAFHGTDAEARLERKNYANPLEDITDQVEFVLSCS